MAKMILSDETSGGAFADCRFYMTTGERVCYDMKDWDLRRQNLHRQIPQTYYFIPEKGMEESYETELQKNLSGRSGVFVHQCVLADV